MNHVLLINPGFPPIHQSFDYVLPMLEAKFIAPPLSLLTVAALIPEKYTLRLVDENVRALTDEDLRWADCVLVTGIGAQAGQMLQTVQRCKACKPSLPLILGGLHISIFNEKFLPYADAIVCGESEAVIRRLFQDLEQGTLRKFYNERLEFVEMASSPCPRFDLVKPADYLIWTLQYSRGCPHNCEFCELPRFYGHRPREKAIPQFLAEMSAVYALGFRGTIMLGMDGDPENIGELQFDFLQQAGTPRAMISVLRVYRGSRLYAAMAREGRILCDEPSGDQTGDFVLNYQARMGNERLLETAVGLLKRLYEPRHYFQRCWRCVKDVRRVELQKGAVSCRSLRWVWNSCGVRMRRATTRIFCCWWCGRCCCGRAS